MKISCSAVALFWIAVVAIVLFFAQQALGQDAALGPAPAKVDGDEPPVGASSIFCKYCKYCEFCDKCIECPCTHSSDCQFCKYCTLCSACSICSYCHSSLMHHFERVWGGISSYFSGWDLFSEDQAASAVLDDTRIEWHLASHKAQKRHDKELNRYMGRQVAGTDAEFETWLEENGLTSALEANGVSDDEWKKKRERYRDEFEEQMLQKKGFRDRYDFEYKRALAERKADEEMERDQARKRKMSAEIQQQIKEKIEAHAQQELASDQKKEEL